MIELIFFPNRIENNRARKQQKETLFDGKKGFQVMDFLRMFYKIVRFQFVCYQMNWHKKLSWRKDSDIQKNL